MDPNVKTKEEPEMEIINRYSEEYRQVPVNGVLGGINPRGQLHIDWCHERYEIPRSVAVEIKDNVGRRPGIPGVQNIERIMQFGVDIEPHDALSVAVWILHHVLEGRPDQEQLQEHLVKEYGPLVE